MGTENERREHLTMCVCFCMCDTVTDHQTARGRSGRTNIRGESDGRLTSRLIKGFNNIMTEVGASRYPVTGINPCDSTWIEKRKKKK